MTTLRNTPVETLTPLQALNLLHELKGKSLNGPRRQAGRGAFPQDDHDTVQFPLGFPGETISF